MKYEPVSVECAFLQEIRIVEVKFPSIGRLLKHLPKLDQTLFNFFSLPLQIPFQLYGQMVLLELFPLVRFFVPFFLLKYCTFFLELLIQAVHIDLDISRVIFREKFKEPLTPIIRTRGSKIRFFRSSSFNRLRKIFASSFKSLFRKFILFIFNLKFSR